MGFGKIGPRGPRGGKFRRDRADLSDADEATRMLELLDSENNWVWALNRAKEKDLVKTVVQILAYWKDRQHGKAAQSILLGGSGGKALSIIVKLGVDGHPSPTDGS